MKNINPYIAAFFAGLMLAIAATVLTGCPQAATDDQIQKAIESQDLVINTSHDPAAVAKATENKQKLVEAQKNIADAEKSGSDKGNAVMGAVSAGGSLVPIPGVGAVLGLIASTGLAGWLGKTFGGMKWRKYAAQIIDGLQKGQDPAVNPNGAQALKAALEDPNTKNAIHSAMDKPVIATVQAAIAEKPSGPLALAA